jgi:hypothetical protein
MFNVLQFYKDYHIDCSDSGSKHCRKGWINIDCVFCGGDDYHLGINISTGACKCWKCGNHSQLEVIKELLECDYNAAKDIHKEYCQNDNRHIHSSKSQPHREHKTTCEYPTGTSALNDRQRAYLELRGFDSYELEKTWGLKGTGNLGDYKFRIIAPIMYNGKMVSYQGRDYTGKSELRYKACKQENEVIEHQTIVYGLDLVGGERALLVEGIFDCFRFGAGAISCFGIAFTTAQVNLIASRIRFLSVLFDAEEQAQKQARAIAIQLTALGVEVEILDISDTKPEELVDPEKGIDPGNLLQSVADKIKKELEL